MEIPLISILYLCFVADHVHLLMESVFPDACGLFQLDNSPYQEQCLIHVGLRKASNMFVFDLVFKLPSLSSKQQPIGFARQTKAVNYNLNNRMTNVNVEKLLKYYSNPVIFLCLNLIDQ